MSIVDPASRVAALIDDTTALQRKAADPQASAWVSANAGTGKTHVLTQRVLRLLLAGAAPARIVYLWLIALTIGGIAGRHANLPESRRQVFSRLSTRPVHFRANR